MSARLRAPAPRYGNKAAAASLIEGLMGPINNLVVPFAGMLGEVLGRSEPAKVETVNDLEGHVVNVWRSIKYAPDRVAALCDHPVHELTLHAVHDRLVQGLAPQRPCKRALKSGRRRQQSLAEFLRADERAFDVEIAAKWIWGQSCWLGSGWCREVSRKRPALAGQGDRPHLGYGVCRPRTSRKIPRIGGPGSGKGRPDLGRGVARPTWRARPQLSHAGQGVTLRGFGQTRRQKPYLIGGAGRPGYGKGVHAKSAVTPRQIPMVSGSYTGHPAHGNGVHSGTHRENLIEWMRALSERLRWTRIICGHWLRALTEAVTTSHGVTGVSLDPPYCHTLRNNRLYAEDDPRLSADVRAWALSNGDNPLLRIVLCGKWDEHDELLERGWTKHLWRADGETIWASPHCCSVIPLPQEEPAQGDLFGGLAP